MQQPSSRISLSLGLSGVALLLGGCATGRYTPPVVNSSPSDYTVVVDRSFDETWKKLIDYAAGTFFAIDNYEKASGLLTLSFGSANPPEFITGGPWEVSNMVVTFEGDYVEYLSTYAQGRLDGRMNIVVSQEGPQTTRVTVNARYIFAAQFVDGPRDQWTFNSGNCGTTRVTNPSPGTPPFRTICPTYTAERAILAALK